MSLPYLVQTFETVQTSLHIRIKLNRESMYLLSIKGTGSPDFFYLPRLRFLRVWFSKWVLLLKGKNLLLEEQILSYKSRSPLTKETKQEKKEKKKTFVNMSFFS